MNVSINIFIFFVNHSNCDLGSYVSMSVLHTYEGYSEIVFIYVYVVCVCVCTYRIFSIWVWRRFYVGERLG